VSTAALLTASVTSTGGVAMLFVRTVRNNQKTNDEREPNKNGEKENG
jgi:hypothetical protein